MATTRVTVAVLAEQVKAALAIASAEIKALEGRVEKLTAQVQALAAPATAVAEPRVVDVSAPTPFYRTKAEAIEAGRAACRLYGRRSCKVAEVRPGEWGFSTYG